MPVKPFRCTVTTLTIRTQPHLGDQFKTTQQIKLNEVVNVDDASRTEADGFTWLKHDRGWSAERTLDGRAIYLLDATLKAKEKLWGINVDPYNLGGNPKPSKLAGLGWVRFVFHASSKGQTPEQAFAYYDPIIQAYVQAGVKVLLVVLQDTFWGNAPWSNGGWDVYTRGFADAVGKIARHYRDQVVAYEIWNEQDLSGQPTSIPITPQNYAPLLLAAAQAVKLGDPQATVINGGLVSADPVGYLKQVRSSLGGLLPVDGIAIHPYGKTPPNTPVFPGYSTGSLGGVITQMVDTFPGTPIWITEIGVPRVNVNNTALWPAIANYMYKTYQLIHDTYFHVDPVLIWFAWTDSMDSAGIVHDNQQPKGAIFDTFFMNLRFDQPPYFRTADTPYNGDVMLTHVSGQVVAEQSIPELVQRIGTLTPNVRGLLVTSAVGTTWAGVLDSKKSMAINGPADLGKWASELAKYCIKLHAWHDLVGQNTSAEIALIVQAATAPGVESLVLDLDPARLVLKTSDAIRNFMVALKQALPQNYHIGVSFDGRLDRFQSVAVPEWYPFINSWHPKVFHWQFSNTGDGPLAYVGSAFQGLKPYPRPVIPMLQAEPTAGKPVPPDQMKTAAKLALEQYNAPGVSYHRLGAIGPAEFSAIQSVYVPYLAGFAPAPKSADVLTVLTTAPLRIRQQPSLTATVAGTLQPGEQITVLERSVSGPLLWVRHSRGWTLARNSQTGEIFLA